MPVPVTWVILGLCVLPILLNSLGINFASATPIFNPAEFIAHPQHNIADAMHYALSGSFTHTLLEWTAFCLAIVIVILAFAHYTITHEITTPIIGMALFCAGTLDAFHTLAADRLIHAVADNHNLIPFTWAISRVFNAIILIMGTGIVLLRKSKTTQQEAQSGMGFVLGISLIFGIIAYQIIHICATSDQLPETMFPEATLTRPWDVAPLVLYVLAGVYVFPKFYRQHPSLFAHALIVSTIPQVVTQMHMAFGSTMLFDNHFNIAHAIKILAYAVPFAGLVLDYIHTYRTQQASHQTLEQAVSARTKTLETQTQHILDEVDHLVSSVSEISTAIVHLATSTTQTTTALTETTTTMEEIRQTAEKAGQEAHKVSHEAQEAAQVSEEGTQATQETVQGMMLIETQMKKIAQSIVLLSQQSQSISNIMITVNDLAEQSNMLAVNAAIQAARAGKEGQGFAVVAREVRNLSEKSKAATGQVRQILQEVHNAVTQAVHASESGNKTVVMGVEQSEKARKAIRVLSDQIGSAASTARTIATSGQEQMIKLQHMTQAMESIRMASEQNSNTTHQLNEEAQNLNALGQRLKKMTDAQ